jgi:hypothetical protein
MTNADASQFGGALNLARTRRLRISIREPGPSAEESGVRADGALPLAAAGLRTWMGRGMIERGMDCPVWSIPPQGGSLLCQPVWAGSDEARSKSRSAYVQVCIPIRDALDR